MALAARRETSMERKIISISSKRQVTIPQKYFELLGFDSEAECILQDGGLFIRPVRIGGNEFAEQILTDLLTQGYSGSKLLEQFKVQSRKVRPAVEKLVAEADLIAEQGSGVSIDELFGVEDE